MNDLDILGCGSASHFNRRTLLQAAGLSGLCWLTPLAESLSRAGETSSRRPKSVIVLWMAGGPSQLETFDPKPGTNIAGGTLAINTVLPGVQLAAGYEQVAEQLHHISLVRSVISKEGDHERATYNVKTGFRPDPTLVHPSIGAVICHKLTDNIEIPRHVSIVPGQWPARGGYLGDQYDAFKINDPKDDIPDVKPRVSAERFQQRINDLKNFPEAEFARGRLIRPNANETLAAAQRMMDSDQLQAFNVMDAPASERDPFGDTPFGRGCLAAARLVEVGVRCVEVTLQGWDAHVNNHETHKARAETLDPAFASLIRYLHQRELLDDTIVICGGEFGRTPRINPAGGRDHWPHGFTIAMAGGGIAGGRVIGETSPNPDLNAKVTTPEVEKPQEVANVHATVLKALDIDFTEMLPTPVGRPMVISEGIPIDELLV